MYKLLILVLFSFMFLMARAETIHVPADTATIQGAINMASNGDTVLVADGTYYENISFKGKAITVASHFLVDGNRDHIAATVIDGSQPANPDSATVVFFKSGEDSNSVLCGFTITGGKGTKFLYDNIKVAAGGGIFIWESGAKIIHNIITKNTITQIDRYCYGGGIETWSFAANTIVISDNEISHNRIFADWGGGGGAELSTAGLMMFHNNYVHHNLFNAQRAGHGGGLVALGSADGIAGKLIMTGNVITNNIARGGVSNSYGGGFYTEYPLQYLFRNIIANNQAHYGGGIYLSHFVSWPVPVKSRFINNTITGNKADHGGAFYGKDSEFYLFNSIVWDNPSDYQINGIGMLEFHIGYSNIQGGWAGIGNIDMDPVFHDSVMANGDTLRFCLMPESPCIDAGVDSMFFRDMEDRTKMGMAHWPAMGGLRNDMGAYGGEFEYDLERLEESLFILDLERMDYNPVVPFSLNLYQNYPNPFNPSTSIDFHLPQTGHTELIVYDMLGREIKTLVADHLTAGKYTYHFDATNLASGVYYYQLIAGDFKQVKKMVLLK